MASSAPARPRLPERLDLWLNDPVEPLWERPGPTRAQVRNDVIGTAVFLVVALLMVLLSKSVGASDDEATWRGYVATALMILPLLVRRTHPLSALVLSSALFLGLTYLSVSAAIELAFQGAYFAAIYAAVAWARDRRMLWIAMSLVLLTMTLWLVSTFTMATGFMDQFERFEPDGPVPQLAAAVLYTSIINLAYFGGAIAAGRASWRSALQRERLAEQTVQVREQAGELARRAVVDERLRIARELHDVVAHHVSVIGVQAGAARKVLTRNPDAAAEALRTIEASSRQAVGDMRSLLGVLRSETDTDRPDGSRAPEPGLGDLADLVEVQRAGGLDVDLTVVEDALPLADVPGPVALSLFRTVQESLSNVARHSTASHARVTVRTGTTTHPVTDEEHPAPDDPASAAQPTVTRWIEAEVLDDGQQRPGTSGSGYGLRGIRERVQLHRGEAEVGPRLTGTGWRVRVRFPLDGASPTPSAPPARPAPPVPDDSPAPPEPDPKDGSPS
ncbi:sensor histidine kinase [Sanguibacter suaedae]|uniref:histidine kinase n=1 Tax=Sanguibacter suaedae TaxID=2795737 RepID=A0A934I9Q7_9MICO|nr:histidine kinase [Sanguibacter suaedae]MBI9115667.1 sensor histidine kinase [Sanguibacter suaedae]